MSRIIQSGQQLLRLPQTELCADRLTLHQSNLSNLDTLPVIVPDWPDLPAHVHAFTTTRNGGVSRPPFQGSQEQGGLNLGDHVGDDLTDVEFNRDKLNKYLPNFVTFLSQTHGNMALDVTSGALNRQADAGFTAQPGVVCAVLTADCLPVLFSDRQGKIVAAAHAGWRGLANGILQQTIQQMRQAGAREILAWMGPAIGAQRFEVGTDVLKVFLPQVQHATDYFLPVSGLTDSVHVPQCGAAEAGKPEKFLMDIYGLARQLMKTAGVAQISGGEYCTVEQEQLFYSYRRDGQTGRMASLIWIDDVQ